MGRLRRVTPISPDFGLHRGTPVDRHYIDEFLARHGDAIRGRVLEVGERLYVREPGAFAARQAGEDLPPLRGGVEQADVLDISPSNEQATVFADLNDPEAAVPEATFDCVLCTQTLQFIYDVPAAIRTLHRALKPGGALLITLPGISQIAATEVITSPGITAVDYPDADEGLLDYWRFTPASIAALVEPDFGDRVTIESFGNVLSSVAFLHGLTAEDLRKKELAHRDPEYPLLLGVRAVRPG
jgi:SAM-dependent methyltransferase